MRYDETISVIPNLGQLTQEIGAVIAPAVVLALDFYKGKTQPAPWALVVETDVVLTPAQVAAMQAAIAAHVPYPYVAVVFYASSSLVTETIPIVGLDPVWTTIASTITTPGFFSADLANMWANLLGVYSATGNGAKLRLLETDPSGTNPITAGEWALTDTAGASTALDAQTLPGSLAGTTKRYILQAQLNGATSASLLTCEAALVRGVLV